MKKIIFSKSQVSPLDIEMLFSESKSIVDLVLPNSNLIYIEDLIHRIKPYKISKCNEANLKQNNFGLMLRHDVDHSIDLAYLMSIVEDMHKIKSTYLHSLTRINAQKMIMKILKDDLKTKIHALEISISQ